MVIRTLIVDDEEPAREEIKFLLSHFDDFVVVGDFSNAFDALNAIMSGGADIVFFDIDMPGFSGIQLAEALKSMVNSPLVVFISAYSGYAVKAFELNAVDYLVKPVDPKRFSDMICRVKKKLSNRNAAIPNFIIGENKGSLFLLKPEDIIYFYSKKERIFAKTKAGEMYCKGLTLQSAGEKLKPYNFFRVHKGFLININEIQKVIPWFKGKYVIEMSNNDRVPLSPHRQKEFRENFLNS